MKKRMIIGAGILGILSLGAFTKQKSEVPESTFSKIKQVDNDITAIISKNTSQKELEDLKKFFSENGIELTIEKIKYNENDEIIELSLILTKDQAKSRFSSSSNQPIGELELGYKNGSLYITNSGMFDISAWKNQSNIPNGFSNLDSLLSSQNLHFDFNFKDLDSIFFNGSGINIDELKEKVQSSFHFDEEDGKVFINKQSHPFSGTKSNQYNFINDPSIEKLIIIDGKESNFETLDQLAKADELEEVDFLKPETAISIYGDKAKDGAIIATTKK